jgi:hypothetical protein
MEAFMGFRFLFIFIFILFSCGKGKDDVRYYKDNDAIKKPLGLDGEIFPDNEISEDERIKISEFPVLLDDLIVDKAKSVLRKNEALDYILREKFIAERILNKTFKMPNMGKISRSVLVKKIEKKINHVTLRLKFSEKISSGLNEVKLLGVRLKILKKRVLAGNFTSFGEININFLRDFGREIILPLFINDQTFSVRLPRPLDTTSGNQYIFFVENAELEIRGRKVILSLEKEIKGKRHCYYSLEGEKVYKSSIGLNCMSLIKKKHKVVLDYFGENIVSVNQKNNYFLKDLPSYKLRRNNLNSFGFFHEKFSPNKKDFYLMSFKYRDLIDLIPYKRNKNEKLIGTVANNVRVIKLAKLNVSVKKIKTTARIKKRKRYITVRSLGSRPGDVEYFSKSSDLYYYDGQREESINTQKSKIFKLSGAQLESKRYLVESENIFIQNKASKLRKKEYEIGDSLKLGGYMIISNDYKKRQKKYFVNDTYEVVFLETFLPSW